MCGAEDELVVLYVNDPAEDEADKPSVVETLKARYEAEKSVTSFLSLDKDAGKPISAILTEWANNQERLDMLFVLCRPFQ